jgi:DNA-binding transcriptional regulator GbsR (MarR family)
MGTRWGINRPVAQIHALLFISQKPLNAEDILQTLSVARLNVSNSLKELQGGASLSGCTCSAIRAITSRA